MPAINRIFMSWIDHVIFNAINPSAAPARNLSAVRREDLGLVRAKGKEQTNTIAVYTSMETSILHFRYTSEHSSGS